MTLFSLRPILRHFPRAHATVRRIITARARLEIPRLRAELGELKREYRVAQFSNDIIETQIAKLRVLETKRRLASLERFL
jgi:hypothetical protein